LRISLAYNPPASTDQKQPATEEHDGPHVPIFRAGNRRREPIRGHRGSGIRSGRNTISTISTIGAADSAAPRTRTSALDRAVQILDALQQANRPATAYEVARIVGAPLSTVYSIINDLVEKNLLARRMDGTIWLGSRLYGYGLSYASSLDYLTVAHEEMQRLSAEVEETVQVCGLEDGMMVVQQMAEGPGHFRVTSRVGSRVPLNWTASGRLLVGHLPDAERVAFLRSTRSARPPAARKRGPRYSRGSRAKRSTHGCRSRSASRMHRWPASRRPCSTTPARACSPFRS
jgi:DNA-binding IclR family transcriptional regulator